MEWGLGLEIQTGYGTSHLVLQETTRKAKSKCVSQEKKEPQEQDKQVKNQTLHQEEVGGVGHHVRGYGMSPRRYILGA